MNQGRRVLRWAHENRYTLEWVAEQIGYLPHVLSEALHKDRITPELAKALLKRFGLRLIPSASPCDQDDNARDYC